ncbi:MAG: WD40/YVTN/BNR-like repeat-containing protein, partial [Phycisphaerales bacterium JB039]
VVWIDPEDPRHLWVGCDGGLYETFNAGDSWRQSQNLPVTQFYRVAVDNDLPFYNVYGGTQDNNTLGGPSRTTESQGILNQHWFITTGGDGFEPAVDPEDPDTVYSQSQYGGLVRYDRRSGQTVDIRPREAPGEEPYVFNWDSPLMISPHSHTRLYFGGDRVFRSDDRGNSWEVVSPRLSRGIDRNTLEVMGKIQPPEAVDKHLYTSIYGSVVALSESPLVEGLLYAGTDDGLIQVSEDGGETWRKIDAFAGVPHMTYVSDIEASQHDADTVYATFDNHKRGDFASYALKSTDRGETWSSISGDLPERHVVYALKEDHVDPDLLFVGTEFACFWTRTGGKQWHRIGGLPPIAVRDVEIQRREDDLVLATFGRGFYILDDYSPIREANDELLGEDAYIFELKDALQYIPNTRYPTWSQGETYSADNPPFGAIFTVHIKDVPQTAREKRQRKGPPTAETYPTIDELRAEDLETAPELFLTIRDGDGEIVRRLDVGRRRGMQRISWDLRWAGSGGRGRGPLALPGTYSAQLSQNVEGVIEDIGEPREFNVVALDRATFEAEDPGEALAFQRRALKLYSAVQGTSRAFGEVRQRHSAVRDLIAGDPAGDLALLERLHELKGRLDALSIELSGDSSAARRQLPTSPSISERAGAALFDQLGVTSAPTQTQRDQYEYASEALGPLLDELRAIDAALREIEEALQAAGLPWTPGRIPEWDGGG